MSDDISQATPAEPITPESVEVPEIAPQGSAPQQEQPKEKQDETPLTPAELRRIAREEAGRVANNLVQKGETRIQKLIQSKFSALEQTKGALGLSDEQVNQARQKIVTEAYASEEEETPPINQPASKSSDVDEAISYMNAQIQATFAEVGTTVTKDDPEFKALQDTVNLAWNDPNGLAKIIRAADKAATAKAARLQNQQSTAAARVIGGGTSSGGQPRQPSSAHDAWSEAYKTQ